MDNQQFLQSIGVTNPETVQKCLQAMEKYGDNHWWEPDVDLRTYAYHQLHEELLLRKSISDFKQGLAEIVNRDVYTHDLVDDEFKQEVERAWRWDVGATSEVEKLERLEAGIDRLKQKFPGKVVEVNLPPE